MKEYAKGKVVKCTICGKFFNVAFGFYNEGKPVFAKCVPVMG